MEKQINRKVAFVILTLISEIASADWTIAGKTAKTDFYVDLSTIVKNGDKTKMWSLQDLNQGLTWGKHKELVLSIKDYQQYDCTQKTRLLIMSILHSEHMGKGDVVFSFDVKPTEKDWVSVTAGGAGDALWKIACGKK